MRCCGTAAGRDRTTLPRQAPQASGCGQRSLGFLDDRLEALRLADGDVRQNLAVDLDPGLAEAVDKSAVGQAVLAHRGVEALDPQGAERALLVLAVAIGVLH